MDDVNVSPLLRRPHAPIRPPADLFRFRFVGMGRRGSESWYYMDARRGWESKSPWLAAARASIKGRLVSSIGQDRVAGGEGGGIERQIFLGFAWLLRCAAEFE